MEITAKLRYLRISPRKVRLVIDIIRGMRVEEAEYQLNFLNKGSSRPILKLLKSAVANAENNFEKEKDNLFIKKIFVDQGPTLKRWKSRAFGRAAEIRKRSSHVTIILDEIKESKSKKKTGTKKNEVKSGKTKSTTNKKAQQKVVDYKEVKKDSKFSKDDKEKDNIEEQQNKPTSGIGKIRDRFSRRLGEK